MHDFVVPQEMSLSRHFGVTNLAFEVFSLGNESSETLMLVLHVLFQGVRGEVSSGTQGTHKGVPVIRKLVFHEACFVAITPPAKLALEISSVCPRMVS